MNRSQAQFGQPAPAVSKKIESRMNEMVREFIAASPFCVLATSNEDGACDASPKGGSPGFVKVLDERRLLIPDVAGNKLFQSYENVDSNPSAGLLFLLPGCDWTVRVNGAARPVDTSNSDELGTRTDVLWKDDNTRVIQGLLVDVHEAYAHCPRAFLFSNLWETRTIEEAKAKDSNQHWFKRYQQALKAP